ncbi:hypothetical protein [Taklimakanibacter deserti]|uniref:hypothetical protein n=1 Tax=Taklimakanibacter deserti TaxID=2267839 RepID=UPI000E64FCB1
MSSTAALRVQDKLGLIAGPGKLQQKITEARRRLARINNNRWRSPLAPGRIKRFLYGEQKPEFEEVDDIREAYQQFCDEKVRLAKRVLANIEYAQRTDPEMYGPQIEQLIAVLDQLRPFLHGRL